MPSQVGKLVNLKHLNIYENNLKYLLKEIGNLSNLEVFNCQENSLLALPVTIGNWKKLHTLKIDQNKLSYLPNTIGNLYNFKLFHCHQNQLKALPNTIGKLIKLDELDISKNLIAHLPPEIIKMVQTFTKITKNCFTASRLEPKILLWQVLFYSNITDIKHISILHTETSLKTCPKVLFQVRLRQDWKH